MVALDATTQTSVDEELGGRVKPDHGERGAMEHYFKPDHGER
jgi:hypothetical protein